MQNKETIIKLESLIELSAKLNSADNINMILSTSLLTLMGKLLVTKSCVLHRENNIYKIINRKGNIKLDSLDYFNVNQIESVNNVLEASPLLDEGLMILIPMKIELEEYLICLGTRELKTLAEDETKYAFLVSNITANAIKNAQNVISLKNQKLSAEKQNQLLTTMFEIRKDFSNLHTREQLLKMLSLNLMGQLMISKFAAISINDAGTIQTLISRFSSKFTNDELQLLSKSEKLLCLQCNDIVEQHKLIIENHDACVTSPAFVQGSKKGLLIVGAKMNGEAFTEDDLKFIDALGATFFTELENERLFREEIEKKRLESELSLALDIQKNLLPKKSPEIPNYEIYGQSIPSRHVGGDYFDYIVLDDKRFLFIVADVSGKGIPASLIMANVQAALRSISGLNLTLSEIVKSINKLLFVNTSADKFVTAFLGIINSESNDLTYINAGHNPPYLIRNNDLNTLNEGGLLLGIMQEAPEYEIGKIMLEKNDLIYIFTDGVTESKSITNDEFGEERLERLLLSVKDKSCEEITSSIFKEVNQFAIGAGQYDDLTSIAIKIK